MAVMSALKILILMEKLSNYYYSVKVNGVRYAVKYGKLEEFICLFRPHTVIVLSMTDAPLSWKHDFEWYKRI